MPDEPLLAVPSLYDGPAIRDKNDFAIIVAEIKHPCDAVKFNVPPMLFLHYCDGEWQWSMLPENACTWTGTHRYDNANAWRKGVFGDATCP